MLVPETLDSGTSKIATRIPRTTRPETRPAIRLPALSSGTVYGILTDLAPP
jgi:hypothetical protein